MHPIDRLSAPDLASLPSQPGRTAAVRVLDVRDNDSGQIRGCAHVPARQTLANV